MKKFWFTILLIFALVKNVFGVDVTLVWDLVTTPVDGYILFQAINDEPFIYDLEDSNTSVIWRGKETTHTITGLGVDGQSVSYRWIARSFLCDANGDLVPSSCLISIASDDSNELIKIINLEKPIPINNLTSMYNENNEVILNWTNTDEFVFYWKIYFRTSTDGVWEEFTQVNNSGNVSDVSASGALSLISSSINTFEFVVVAFKSVNTYSDNSNISNLVIDLRTKPQPVQLRILTITN